MVVQAPDWCNESDGIDGRAVDPGGRLMGVGHRRRGFVAALVFVACSPIGLMPGLAPEPSCGPLEMQSLESCDGAYPGDLGSLRDDDVWEVSALDRRTPGTGDVDAVVVELRSLGLDDRAILDATFVVSVLELDVELEANAVDTSTRQQI